MFSLALLLRVVKIDDTLCLLNMKITTAAGLVSLA